MSDQNDQLMAVLRQLHDHYPHWRFGQLVCNVAMWAGDTEAGHVWDVSDEALLRAARQHLLKLSRGRAADNNNDASTRASA
jgi:hypothetical protein